MARLRRQVLAPFRGGALPDDAGIEDCPESRGATYRRQLLRRVRWIAACGTEMSSQLPFIPSAAAGGYP